MKTGTIRPAPNGQEISPDPAFPPARRHFSPKRILFFLVPTVLLIVAGLRVADAWHQTERREAFLPQIEVLARRDPHDGPLLALLGARRAEAHDPTAADALRHAVVSGEGTEPVWQALAAATAAIGDRSRALADLKLGRKALGTAPALDDALARAEALGPAPDPIALAQAIAPDGPAPPGGRLHARQFPERPCRVVGAAFSRAERVCDPAGVGASGARGCPGTAALGAGAAPEPPGARGGLRAGAGRRPGPELSRRPPGAGGRIGPGGPAREGRPGIHRLPEAAP